MGFTSFWGFSCPNLLLVFLNMLFLRTCQYNIFLASVGTFSESFFIFLYLVPYFGLACNHGNSFLSLEE